MTVPLNASELFPLVAACARYGTIVMAMRRVTATLTHMRIVSRLALLRSFPTLYTLPPMMTSSAYFPPAL